MERQWGEGPLIPMQAVVMMGAVARARTDVDFDLIELALLHMEAGNKEIATMKYLVDGGVPLAYAVAATQKALEFL